MPRTQVPVVELVDSGDVVLTVVAVVLVVLSGDVVLAVVPYQCKSYASLHVFKHLTICELTDGERDNNDCYIINTCLQLNESTVNKANVQEMEDTLIPVVELVDSGVVVLSVVPVVLVVDSGVVVDKVVPRW